jgi:hypothetical protein
MNHPMAVSGPTSFGTNKLAEKRPVLKVQYFSGVGENAPECNRKSQIQDNSRQTVAI